MSPGAHLLARRVVLPLVGVACVRAAWEAPLCV